jgi:hypothetical protein
VGLVVGVGAGLSQNDYCGVGGVRCGSVFSGKIWGVTCAGCFLLDLSASPPICHKSATGSRNIPYFSNNLIKNFPVIMENSKLIETCIFPVKNCQFRCGKQSLAAAPEPGEWVGSGPVMDQSG